MQVDLIEEHWAPSARRGELLDRVLAGLAQSGADVEALTPRDLAPVDEFHMRGREATHELAELLQIPAGARVLDVGSGLGGPSRMLASEYGCRVTGVDLTREYCSVATELARRSGLADRVSYRRGDATRLPFPEGSFDVVWTQHVSMNVPDKRAMFAEMARVLRPGGQVAIYDPIAGCGRPRHLPLPWAERVEMDHLESLETTLSLLADVRLRPRVQRDVTEQAITWFHERLAAGQARSAPPALGFHLLLGPRWSEMARTLLRNLEEGRIRAVQLVLQR